MSSLTLERPCAAEETLPDATSQPLTGQRCLLRQMQPDDAPLMLAIHNKEPVLRHMHDLPFATDFWCHPEAFQKYRAQCWRIEVEGQTIGCTMMIPGSHIFRCSAEVGYWLDPAYWGRGIATEVLALVTAWSWPARPELTRLFMGIYSSNLASQRVAAKCGYEREGVQRRSLMKSGRAVDIVMYASYRN
jgi:ribosomal-protein-alanine N-acetyltransferase